MPKLYGVFLIVTFIIHHSQGEEWKNEENCGISFTHRIIGGKLSANGKYPWLARLGYKTRIKGKYTYSCGGTLINRKFVLTAAHCVVNKNNLDIVHVGETASCVKSPCEHKRVQEIKIKKVIMHKEFSTKNGYADIALLELGHPVKFTKWVRPICLPNKPVEKIGDKSIVAGWGMENYITRERPNSLKELTLQIIPGDVCKKYFPQSDFTSANYICGGGNAGEDTCGGDSGGPLMKVLNTGSSPRMHLLGAISFGSTKCGVGVPGIYTSISYHLKWIADHAHS